MQFTTNGETKKGKMLMAKTTHYADDRSYTDTIHDSIIVPKIYPQLGWTPYALEKELAQLQDSDYAIDYHATNKNGELIAIQERFRRGRAAKMYNDFTLRYERENNEEESVPDDTYTVKLEKINKED